MSLIPSESLNFPDSFRANVGWRIVEEEDDVQALEALQQAMANGGSAPAPKPPEDLQAAEAHQVKPSQTLADTAPATTVSERTDDPERDLISNPATIDSRPSETLTSMAEMSALLSHFMSSAASREISPVSPNGDAMRLSPETDAEAGNSVVEPHWPSFSKPPQKMVASQEPAPSEESSTAHQPNALTSPSVISPHQNLSPNDFKILPEPAGGLESAGPATTVVNPTPAEANHIFNLIAAAVQRGTLEGESVPQTAPLAPEPPAASQSPMDLVPTPTAPAIPTPSAPVSLPLSTAEKTSGLTKTPAKIRITPRKNIKPHASTESGTETPEEWPPDNEEIDPVLPEPIPAPWKPPLKAVAEKTAPIVRGQEEPLWSTEQVPMPARKVSPSRRGIDRPDTLLFTARERRTRWIGFGLSEAATLASLILLGRYGFVHRFPDPTVKVLIFILILVAAAVAVALPIAFFRNDPARWRREQ